MNCPRILSAPSPEQAIVVQGHIKRRVAPAAGLTVILGTAIGELANAGEQGASGCAFVVAGAPAGTAHSATRLAVRHASTQAATAGNKQS